MNPAPVGCTLEWGIAGCKICVNVSSSHELSTPVAYMSKYISKKFLRLRRV